MKDASYEWLIQQMRGLERKASAMQTNLVLNKALSSRNEALRRAQDELALMVQVAEEAKREIDRIMREG